MERRGAASFGLLALLLVLALQVSVVDPGHGPHDVHLVQTLYPEHMVDKASQYGFGYGKPGVGYAIVKAVCVWRGLCDEPKMLSHAGVSGMDRRCGLQSDAMAQGSSFPGRWDRIAGG